MAFQSINPTDTVAPDRDKRGRLLPDSGAALRSMARLCGAQLRRKPGVHCHRAALKGKERCSLHGGKSPGPPRGNRNAWKHGQRSGAAIKEHGQTKERLKALKLMAVMIGLL